MQQARIKLWRARRWLRERVPRRLPNYHVMRRYPQWVTDTFHRLYYEQTEAGRVNTFLGRPVVQYPVDLWTYQEIIYRERPAFILQTGVLHGGSLLFLAAMLDLIGADPDALVIGVDIDLSRAEGLEHPRIRLIEGDSVADETIEAVHAILPVSHGLVSLDSAHDYDHVRRELEHYHTLIPVGGHLIVEDTNVNGRPVRPDHGPGPYEAVNSFLVDHPNFARDDTLWQRNLFSFHQGGWLVRMD